MARPRYNDKQLKALRSHIEAVARNYRRPTDFQKRHPNLYRLAIYHGFQDILSSMPDRQRRASEGIAK